PPSVEVIPLALLDDGGAEATAARLASIPPASRPPARSSALTPDEMEGGTPGWLAERAREKKEKEEKAKRAAERRERKAAPARPAPPPAETFAAWAAAPAPEDAPDLAALFSGSRPVLDDEGATLAPRVEGVGMLLAPSGEIIACDVLFSGSSGGEPLPLAA